MVSEMDGATLDLLIGYAAAWCSSINGDNRALENEDQVRGAKDFLGHMAPRDWKAMGLKEPT